MDELQLSNAAAPIIAMGIVQRLKAVLGDYPWFKRVLPLLPMVVCFALSFIPGLGLATAPIGTKIAFALGAGGLSNALYELDKKNLSKKVGNEHGQAPASN